jgi:hypothetical protein
MSGVVQGGAMNRSQALRELELLENYEFDRGDAPVRLLSHLSATTMLEVVQAALRAATAYMGLARHLGAGPRPGPDVAPDADVRAARPAPPCGRSCKTEASGTGSPRERGRRRGHRARSSLVTPARGLRGDQGAICWPASTTPPSLSRSADVAWNPWVTSRSCPRSAKSCCAHYREAEDDWAKVPADLRHGPAAGRRVREAS